MTVLTTSILGPSGILRKNLFAPFTVYARLVQNSRVTMAGNRWEKIRAEEHTADLIEISLRDLVKNGESASTDDDYEVFVSFPIAFTRQFGQSPAHITISGSYRGSVEAIDTSGEKPFFPPKEVAEDVEHINANEIRSGQGSFNAANIDPLIIVNQFAKQIKDLFSDESRIPNIDRVEVIAVEVFGVKYGRGGRHFPQ